ncbi:GTP cyclohydrolase 1 feedback regulatory protein [Octopus bimaculoides]|uniref:GTP cyclohydrolase 1 feedback regulatory protein n=1 Tax=Octopus bimaculoides TaxID=37653 RepID=A0A0L8IEG9_OCTBM|nr:GTP cyclohydrolase 1 feedback regulatory protein [Octopus bimaculoides]|eukprot:XP_014772206.1 PREDICTED: GTP cyclohydrolase 1 feedback regulatory protein-like [Octopus bimaculoides]
MPYVLVSTQIRLENGPTMVGDEWNDVELMEYLGASLCKELGTNYIEYRTPDPPRTVLNKLETKGYSMVGMAGVGQTCIWTMHKPAKESLDSLPRSVNSKESDSEEKVEVIDK